MLDMQDVKTDIVMDPDVLENLKASLRNEGSIAEGELHPGIKPECFTFTSKQTNLKVYVRSWFPEQKMPLKGIVFSYHGLNTHSGLSNHLAETYNSQGYAFIAHDHASFGRSEGEEGLSAHISSFNVWIQDAIQLIQQITSQPGQNVPFFVVGGSMGGLIAIYVAEEIQKKNLFNGQFKGAVLFSPALLPVVLPNAFIMMIFRFLGNFMSWFLWSSEIVPRPTEDKGKYQCWHKDMIDNGVYDRMFADPLRYDGGMRLSVGYSIKHAAEVIMDDLKRIKFPFMIMHGEEDGVIDWRGSESFYQGAATKEEDKQIKKYPEMVHSLTCDPKTPQVLMDVLSYMNDRINK